MTSNSYAGENTDDFLFAEIKKLIVANDALEARVKTLERNYRSGEGALYDRVAALEEWADVVGRYFNGDEAPTDAQVAEYAADRAQGRRER